MQQECYMVPGVPEEAKSDQHTENSLVRHHQVVYTRREGASEAIGFEQRMGIKILNRDWSDKRVRKCIYRILQSSNLCSMSTVTKANRAHINVAYFAYTKKGRLEIFYISYPDSLHSKNLLSNPSMGMAIYGSHQEWGGHDRGMQLIGSCEEAKGATLRKAESIYGTRFPRYSSWKKQFTEEKGGFQLRSYRFIPTVAKFLDESEKEYGDALVVVRME